MKNSTNDKTTPPTSTAPIHAGGIRFCEFDTFQSNWTGFKALCLPDQPIYWES
jgi:hypothetical protein